MHQPGPTDKSPAETLDDPIPRYADLLAALGTEPRLRIVRALITAHPEGLVVGEVADSLGITGSSLSHHLERLRTERIVTVERQGTFLRYRVDMALLRELVAWMSAECCGGMAADEATD